MIQATSASSDTIMTPTTDHIAAQTPRKRVYDISITPQILSFSWLEITLYEPARCTE